MIKITANHNKKDIIYSFTVGQSFPDVQGKLMKLEINGNELSKFLEVKEIPIHGIDNSYITWHAKQAGSILKILKEIFDT